MKSRRNIIAIPAAIAGVLLLIVGVSSDSKAIERVLLGDATHSLSWGTMLFRVLLAGHGLVLLVLGLRLLRRATRSEPQAKSASPKRKEIEWQPWLVLSALSLVALGLRLWQLNTDLWFDELLTLLNYVRMPYGYIIARLPDQNNHIVFSLFSHASVQLFGESAWAVRLPSVLFGVMSLWVLFLLGRRVLASREALLACMLATVSYHHIWFSQNARGYMALLFFSLLATWIWLEALRRQSWGWWVGYSVAVALGMWTHLTMVFVVIAHTLVYVATLTQAATRGKQEITFPWRPFIALTLSVSLTLQLYAVALPEFLRVGLHEVSLESEWTNPWWVVMETIRNLRIGFSGLLVVLGGAAMVGLGWWNMVRREWQTGLLMVLPALVAGGTMLALGHNLWPRFFFFSMGFALLIAVHGAMSVPQLVGRYLRAWPRGESFSTGAGVALASLMILASALTVPRNYAHPKQDYTGARDYVESQRGLNDAVVAVGLAGVAYKNYFAPTWSVAQTEAELDAIRSGKQEVWLVYTIPVEVKAYRKDVWQTIQSDFAVVKVFPGTLGGGEVVVCRQLPDEKHQVAMGSRGSHSLGIGGK